MKVVKRMVTANCPDCDQKVTLGSNPQEGQKVMCSNCGANLEVVSLDPVELSWDTGEFDDDWDTDEDWDLDEDW